MLSSLATKTRSAIVLGLAVAAVGVPTAQARIAVDPPGSSAGVVGSVQPAPVGGTDRPVAAVTEDATDPNATAGAPAEDPATGTGIHWADALVGVGIGVAAAALALLGFLLSRRHANATRTLATSQSDVR
jgi:hypothetical protein